MHVRGTLRYIKQSEVVFQLIVASDRTLDDSRSKESLLLLRVFPVDEMPSLPCSISPRDHNAEGRSWFTQMFELVPRHEAKRPIEDGVKHKLTQQVK